MENKKKFKISIITEGKTEEKFFIWLKDSSIFKNRTLSICKEHKKNNKGSLSERNIENTSKDCCDKYYIFDVDNIEKQKIEQHKKKCKENNIRLILSDPCLELIFLSFFRFCEQDKLDKKWIEEKLNMELKKINLPSYNHKPESLNPMLEFITESIEHQKDLKSNLIKYKKRIKNPRTNFIDLIKILEENMNKYNNKEEIIWKNAPYCSCGKNDCNPNNHRLCGICLEIILYTSHESVVSQKNSLYAWNIDYIVSKSINDIDSIKNLQAVHISCNRNKNNII